MDNSPTETRTSRSLNLTTGGVTLLGVLLSIGVTVGFGLSGPLWLRLIGGISVTLALVIFVKLATSSGRGPLARAANWVIGTPDADE